MSGLARRLRCTEGQLYTSGLGFVVAVLLLAVGLPPVLRAGPGTTPDGASPAELAVTDRAPVDVAPRVAPEAPAPAAASRPPSLPDAPAVPEAPRGNRPSPSTPPSTSPAAPPSGSPSPPRQLAVIYSGYTSSTGGTPLSGPEVPRDGLPVGSRLGQVDKMSFLRLAGAGTDLRLELVDEPGANQLEATAAVRACPITEQEWSIGEPGAPPAEAPAHDTARCVDGARQDDGAWLFDLSPFAPVDGKPGIALVPVASGGATFQVTFSAVAAAPLRGQARWR